MDLVALVQMLAQIKAEGKTPTATAYIALMKAAASYAEKRGNNLAEDDQSKTIGYEIAMGAMRDAAAGNIELGVEAIDTLFRFAPLHPDIVPSLLIELINLGQSTPAAYTTLAAQAINSSSLEDAVRIVIEMMDANVEPPARVLQHTVRLACEWGMPKLAKELINKYEDMPYARNVEVVTLAYLLQSSATEQYMTGVHFAWGRVVANKSYTPDEGLLVNVLNTAGRRGSTRIAAEAVQLLSDQGITIREQHLAPLIEAFCREGRVPEALKAVTEMRQAGIEPSMRCVQPIIRVLRTPELVDQAFFALEDMHKQEPPVDVDVTALNAVIAASARQGQGDLQRARATQLAAAELGVTPNTDTYNIVLEGCVRARHRELGDTVIGEMINAGVPFNAETYERIITLVLTQRNYEDAFYYLEKMKSERFKPSAALYTRLGRQCVYNQDSRWHLVVEEMKTLNYRVPDFEAEVQDRRARRERNGGAEGQGEGEGGNRRGPRNPRSQNQAAPRESAE